MAANTSGTSWTRRARGAAVVGTVVLGLGGLTAVSAQAETDPCTDGGNAIVCENQKPGSDPDEWDIDGAGDPTIQGFATDISVDAGNPIDFKVDTDAADYSIDIYRTGWYGGLGARHIAAVEPSASLPQTQPECVNDVTTELYDCGNWGVSATWNVPSDATSGVYVALLERADTGGASHITFIVRDDDSTSDIVFQTSDTTWHAYNRYGGSNFYSGAANGRAYKISYNRPFDTRGGAHSRDFFFSAEYPMVRFLEQNGYDVSYIAGVDTDRYGGQLLNHDTFLSVGHDEYWSGRQRENVEAARDAGVNLAFFSGNEMYWRTRWEPAITGDAEPHRTLVSYKETWSNDKIDPSDEWTGTWRDPRFASPANGANLPENGLTGTAYMVNFSDLPVTVSSEEGKLRLWRHTDLGDAPEGTVTELAPHTVGYESNEDLDNGHRPAGLVRLSTTVGDVPEYLQDFGNTVAEGRTRHHVTMYRAESGALVFSAGTVQWSWGLDAVHDGNGAPADQRMRQATVNLLADMSAHPVTPAADVVVATASSDTTGPTVQITSPSAGAELDNGTEVTVTGTASDVDGRVAGVEVSLDGGSSWHPADGRASWSYTGIQRGVGAVEIRARATDDSANIGPAVTRGVDVSCPCTVYGAEVPGITSADDPFAVELGLRFSPETNGYVRGARFYKGDANTGTHRATLWSSTGQALASATFTDETPQGWQTVEFPEAVAVSAGQAYVVSYTAPDGGYAVLENAFSARGIDAYPLAVRGGFGVPAAGVFGSPGSYPTETWGNASYYVDPVFSMVDDSPLTAFSPSPADGTVSVPPDTDVTVRFSRNVDGESVTFTLEDSAGNVVDGTTTYDAATRTARFVPAEPLAGFVEHTATVAATSDDGQPVSDGASWTFRTQRPSSEVCPCGLYGESVVPGITDVDDTDAVTLATTFVPDRDGDVVGAEFFKGPESSGPYTVYLWGPGQAVLASATVDDPVTAGWQSMDFDTPVRVTAGTEYTVGYRTESGRYSVTLDGLRDPLSVGHLSTPANGGAYTYGSGFPSTRTSSSYLVDVRYEAGEATPTIVSTTPAGGSIDVAADADVSVTVSHPLATGSLVVTDALGAEVAGDTTTSGDGLTVTFDPADDLAPGAQYDVAFTGTRASDGMAFPATGWTFVTASPDGTCPCTAFGSATPTTPAADDGASVELGLEFSPDHDGAVTGVRFYKGAGNAGTHTGSLWTAAGEQLAQVTFTGESATGWQTALFAEPVPVQAGEDYVVSYLAPNGRYAADPGDFSVAQQIGPLALPVDASRYVYGGGFPQYTFQATNYYVDLVFVSGDLGLVSRQPSNGATGVDPAATVTAVLSSSPVGETTQLTLTGDDGPIAGTSTFDPASRTVSFTPDGALPSGAPLTARVLVGSQVLDTWTFTVQTFFDPASAVGLWSPDDVPAVESWNDPDAVQVGTRLRANVDGEVVGITFYKGPANSGPHTGFLWSAGGELLASGTFVDATASGWQTLELDAPVAVAAGTELVVSYYAPSGGYAVTANALATPRDTDALSSLANGGVYRYGSTGFPSATAPHSYWADVVFVPAAE